MSQVTEVIKIQRKVWAEITRMTLAGELEANVDEILRTVVTENGPRYRCCVHKERAVLRDRINMALSQPIASDIQVSAGRSLEGHMEEGPLVRVLPEACDRCPIDKFMVTDACRNCLAHNCINSCPKKAIMVVQNRAYIDKTQCVECGMCKKSCSYGAIIEISRPCERACDLKAISAAADRRAAIDYGKCVQCGSCKVACPFGAISDRSFIVQVIQAIKAQKPVYAIIAPAFIGQFGLKVRPGQVTSALLQFGFEAVREVALGADIVTLEETKEFVAAVPAKKKYLTTSCCPAFVTMIEKHLPDSLTHVSTTVSPMIATAKMIKQENPSAVVVFLGPCIAKKAEGWQNRDMVDYVLTFEEMAAMLDGAGINIAETEEREYQVSASRDGYMFARTGGVMQAVADTAAQLAPDVSLKPYRCEGLANCKNVVAQLEKGQIDANFLEGMACIGGCVGGPGTLVDTRVTTRLVDNFAAASARKTAPDNQEAVTVTKQLTHWHKNQ
ncbi:4Fe-4S dicluster domain-containing protein [Acetonema longum]|uniref:Hydrogenase large subunit domain protein n=1 Tax=Acetonema longum DSM 6540 TaxID=1009370 RepID=F7NQ84_9FIRM|nr:4Fe-4S dicluster domain-containing protein [Acetonema longum]EGO61843.1 hydrogenase large subunit domain protein [Acetonema longum DSM 6540]